jgi:hypothetical protein
MKVTVDTRHHSLEEALAAAGAAFGASGASGVRGLPTSRHRPSDTLPGRDSRLLVSHVRTSVAANRSRPPTLIPHGPLPSVRQS